MPKLGGLLRSSDDRGAIMPLFAIILGSGVFMMLIALVVDGGQIYAEKRIVQNAADAVSEAVAQHCAKDPLGANCLTDTFDTKNKLTGAVTGSMTFSNFVSALANPKGGATAVTSICGNSATASGIAACPPLSTSPNDCQVDPNTTGIADWVRVYTSSDPNGIKPAFANFLNASSPKLYQETACSQVYWAKANAIPVDASGGQLPFAISLCDVVVNNSLTKRQMVGDDATVTSCNFTDRRAASFTSTAHGYIDFDPAPANSKCWTLQVSGCSNVVLNTIKGRTGLSYSPLSYSGLIAAMNNNLNKPTLLPVVDRSGAGYKVVSFVSFTLLGYKYPTVVGGTNPISASTANSASQTGAINYTWTGTCAAAQSPTSPFCIVGSFNNRVIAPNGNIPGLSYTTSASVPDLGYQVERHLR